MMWLRLDYYLTTKATTRHFKSRKIVADTHVKWEDKQHF